MRSNNWVYQAVCGFCDKLHFFLGYEGQYKRGELIKNVHCDGTKIGHDYTRYVNMRVLSEGPLRGELKQGGDITTWHFNVLSDT